MEQKICCKCGHPKDLDEFNKRGKYHQPWCKTCQNENARLHYQENKESYREKNKRLRQVCTDYVKELKETSTCSRCPENHPATLQFHHRNPKEKRFEIAEVGSKGYSLDTLKKEIEKCDILCANCHAKEHSGRE